LRVNACQWLEIVRLTWRRRESLNYSRWVILVVLLLPLP
jgi:hypothetical protein